MCQFLKRTLLIDIFIISFIIILRQDLTVAKTLSIDLRTGLELYLKI